MTSLTLSIVIPTYNRRDKLPGAVASALAWLAQAGAGEIVIADDDSTDGTEDMLAERYGREIAARRIRFHRREGNGGPTAAKNSGAALAKGEWIVFLDSDDELIAEALPGVLAALEEAGPAPAVFFRCVEMGTGQLIGEPMGAPDTVGLEREVVGWAWGECLPVVRAEAARCFPYVVELWDYEAVAYARMGRAMGDLVVSPVVARHYRTEGEDRVSALALRARAKRCGHYARIMTREFRDDLEGRRPKRSFSVSCHTRRVLASWSCHRVAPRVPQREAACHGWERGGPRPGG